jgi:hypothetical protein
MRGDVSTSLQPPKARPPSCKVQWAQVGSNHRPPAFEASIAASGDSPRTPVTLRGRHTDVSRHAHELRRPLTSLTLTSWVGTPSGELFEREPLRGAIEVVRRDGAGGAQNDHNERSDTPPMLIQRMQPMAALISNPKDAEQHERGAQN